jgi:hypothetical protein
MPSDEVRVVAMQPFIRFRSDPGLPPREPFRWSEDAVVEQLNGINRVLDISQRSFANRGANFTLFPEYAVPGIEGVSIINDRILETNWPKESIIIAGVHGITKSEYADLCDMLGAVVSQSNAPDSVRNDQWVNCGVIWVKDVDGTVSSWLQPKVRPAWLEMNVSCSDMFCGTTMYVFEGRYEPTGYPCRFVTFVCFDWVASPAGTTVWRELVTQLNELQNEAALDWVFVIQHNKQPNHPSFLNNTYQFLTDTSYAFVQRDKAIVVHANTAVSPWPVRNGQGGFSACVFSPSAQLECNGSRPTVCTQPGSLRGSDILERCKDVVFREMGECIHVFKVRIPRFVNPDATDRTCPLPTADVYDTRDSGDPRLCGGPIPAAVKWINDSLDTIRPMSATVLSSRPLKATAQAVEPSIVTGIRAINGHTAVDRVNWAACSYSNGAESRDMNRRSNADLWSQPETDAMEHLLHSLTAIGMAYSLDVTGAVLHGSIQIDEGFVQIVAIRGYTYQDCRCHYDSLVRQQGPDPVLVIARDRDNFPAAREEFLRLDEIDGERGLAFVDYQTLVNACRTEADTNTLKEMLNAFLPGPRRII